MLALLIPQASAALRSIRLPLSKGAERVEVLFAHVHKITNRNSAELDDGVEMFSEARANKERLEVGQLLRTARADLLRRDVARLEFNRAWPRSVTSTAVLKTRSLVTTGGVPVRRRGFGRRRRSPAAPTTATGRSSRARPSPARARS